ncbi:hypothetical protein AAMO2058_001666400 [Amorphochlora amoebiformis]
MSSRPSRQKSKKKTAKSRSKPKFPEPEPEPELQPHEIKQELEVVEQKITFTLRMLDSSLVEAQNVASGILKNVKTYVTHTKSLNDSLKVWSKFFSSFPSVQAPSFAHASSFGSSIHTTPHALRSSPHSHGEISDLLRKISPPITTPFTAGRNRGLPNEEKSIETFPSLRQISPPLTTPFLPESKSKKLSNANYSCQRQLGHDMTMTSEGKTGTISINSPVMSPATRQLIDGGRWAQDQDQKESHILDESERETRHIHVDSEVSINVGDLSSAGHQDLVDEEIPLASRTTNMMTGEYDFNDINDTKNLMLTPDKGSKTPKKTKEAPNGQARVLDLKLFPSIYQHGRGASQLEQVYMQFISENMTIQNPISMSESVE